MPTTRLTQQEFNRSLWRAIIPPLLLLAGHASVITILLIYWLRMGAMVDRSDSVLMQTNGLVRTLVNMQAGIRGYLLNSDPDFLAQYTTSHNVLDAEIATLRGRVSDEPDQVKRLNGAETAIRAWEGSSLGSANRPTTSSTEPQVLQQMFDRHAMIQTAQAQLDEMRNAELNLLNSRRANEQRAAMMTVFGGVGVSIMVGIGLALINRRTVLRLSSEYQEALDNEAASSKQFLDLAESVPQLIWITDGEGKTLYYNRPWVDYTGVASSQIIADRWEKYLHQEDVGVAGETWKRSLHSGTPFESEYRLKRAADGSYRWFLCRAMPVVDKQGKRVRWFGSCTDIEAQKEVQRKHQSLLEAERSARSDLLHASRMKDQFLATLSHELRTPMSAILGWVYLLRDPKIRQNMLDRALDAVETNAKAQAKLIEDLLDMSRIISGKLTITMERVDLAAVLRSALESVTLAAADRRIQLTSQIDTTREMIVHGDAGRLQQIVLNLLNNAIKFTPREGKVALSAATVENEVEITVSDTGRGISADFLPYVFDRFRQADGSTTRQHGGLGLGLAIVKNLVELHGGCVKVSSAGEKQGTTFVVKLPIAGDAPPAHLPLAERPFQMAMLAGKRAMVVDDDTESSVISQTLLEQAGLNVRLFQTSPAALEELQRTEYDLLISDIAMPELDGYGLMEALRKSPDAASRAVPAIALSAFARPEDRHAALDAGFQDHIAKPFLPQELLRAIANVLSNAQHR